MRHPVSPKLYGSFFTWTLQEGWQAELGTTGTAQIAYVRALFELRRWHDLIPDQADAVVSPGYGTYASDGSVNDSDYVTAAATADGTLAIAYLPTSRTVTVEMSKFAGTVTARWYDPASGGYLTVPGSPFDNSGARQFSPPGLNSDGDDAWILLLEVN